jgi:hypothetical protein
VFLWAPEEDPSQNVLAAWLIRHADAAPAGRGPHLAIAAVGIALLLSLLAFTDIPRQTVEALAILPLLAASVAPLIIAPLTASAIGRQLHVTWLDLLILTNLSGSQLVNGWLAAGTYRLRTWLFLLGGMLVLPPLAAVTLALHYDSPTLLDLFSLLYWVLCLIAFAAGLWSLSLLAVALGVRLAFRWREALALPVLAALNSLGLVTGCLILMVTLLWLAGTTSPWLFGGFCIGMSLFLPYHLRAGQVSSASAWVNAHLLHLPPRVLIPPEEGPPVRRAPYESPRQPTLLFPP